MRTLSAIAGICISGVVLLVGIACRTHASESGPSLNTEKVKTANEAKSTPDNPCNQFDHINSLVRDGKLDKQTALKEIKALIPQLRDYFYKQGGIDNQSGKWTFPLDGYGPKSIGGTNGSGYISKGYDFFDGNKHAGHPAHDIFINDKNQDTLDDCTKRPVDVLSVSNGIVIARETEWQPGSELRGGKYIFIYEPSDNALVYYAHNSEVLVDVGQIVKAGDVIAHVGRTGKSAYERRSPTHLHLMYMTIEDGYPKPVNPYSKLQSATTRPSQCK